MNLNTIQMAVFDMAGTTIDEQNVVYKTLFEAIKNAGFDTNLETILFIGAGKEKFQAIKDILQHLNSNDLILAQEIFNEFNILLDKAYLTLKVNAIEGVESVLINLRNKKIKVVLNTGYSRKVANALLEKLNWKEEIQFDALIAADDVQNGRPSPDMIKKAMEMFHIEDASMVLKAGDSIIDIEEGKNAHCGITIGVLSGAQTKAQLETANPDFIINSLADLNTILN